MAFVPYPLPDLTPPLAVPTFNAVARARAALSALDRAAQQLPNPSLLRRPTLRREAQSTSALEGTFAPLEVVLAADTDAEAADIDLREVLNYVRAADHALSWIADGRPLTVGLLEDVHARLVRGTRGDGDQAGRLRSIQVMLGGNPAGRVREARFVPQPPGDELRRAVQSWVDWVGSELPEQIDPVVAAAMAHHQFETIHPFHDGNGRIGRLLIVVHLQLHRVLREPTLTVSPWFEARRAQYDDALLGVSTRGDWDPWVRFFADGLTDSATSTETLLVDLLAVQRALKQRVRDGGPRADTALQLVDLSLDQPVFTVRQVQRRLGVTYARANGLVGQLVRLGVLAQYDQAAVYDRDFFAPDVFAVLVRGNP